MVATTAKSKPDQHLRTPPPASAGNIRAAGAWREPNSLDYLVFFIGIPVGIAFIFSLVGVRLITGMPYLDGLGYMILHMLTAWWSVSLGAWVIKFAFRSWQPPTIAICVIGYFLALIPAAFAFQSLGEFYGSLYESFAANRADAALPSWELSYLVHFIRYSIPALPMFLAGVYSYRYITGVDWFGYPQDRLSAAVSHMDTVAPRTARQRATARLLGASKLPDDAELLAIKAEQHYIQVWSDRGTDLIRYRFKDLANTLADCNGGQVHRSWWVNFDRVQSCQSAGRKTELTLRDGLKVPVSLAYKNTVIERLDGDPAATTTLT
jgi:hypothetical protein